MKMVTDRVSSFFGDEYILGSFIPKSCILLYVYSHLILKLKYIIYCCIIIILILIILSNERSALLIFTIIFILSFFVVPNKIK